MEKIKVQWLGHSCFKITYKDYSIVIDPYDDTIPGYRPLSLSANAVLCSHGHPDHSYTRAVTLTSIGAPSPFRITCKDCFHDDQWGSIKGTNTIHILDAGGMRICHFGDIGHDLDPGTLELLGKVDLALIPVGGYYTIDARHADALARATEARVVIPMHYRNGALGYDEITTLEPFISLRDDVRFADSDTFELTQKGQPQTVVLRYI